ncbi:hypothetical protein IWQ60_006993 [Tieghemiomyces parasiticus]|uniref:AB hydrolase-1 domain-containing protein n=1 Tax=Tieghemiomyces parasiticus TaxID=78921 RepID=A0A9W8DS15_9FUNG|nr:hypothetical protein IWQ60_006993 [Tieghemiomyces parasiticus]
MFSLSSVNLFSTGVPHLGALQDYLPSLNSHWPTSPEKARAVECKHLSLLPSFRPVEPLEEYLRTLSPDGRDYHARLCEATAVSGEGELVARVGDVAIGQGQFIRTFMIHREHTVHASPSDSAEGNGDGFAACPPSSPTISLSSTDSLPVHPSETAPIVMMHGFGGGLGHYYRNYEALAAPGGRIVYGLDWLGMGLSSRPTDLPWFTSSSPPYRDTSGLDKPSANSTPAATAIDSTVAVDEENSMTRRAEEFFVDGLERWRQAMGIPQLFLIGHSFGGYMCAAYAMKYSTRVEKLLLLSPMGIAEPPPGYREWANRVTHGDLDVILPSAKYRRRIPPTLWKPARDRRQANLSSVPTAPANTGEQRGTVQVRSRPSVAPMVTDTKGNAPGSAFPGFLDPVPGPTTIMTTPDGESDDDPDSIYEVVPLAGQDDQFHLPGSPENFIRHPRLLGHVFAQIWTRCLSPQWFVRALGPLGHTLIRRFCSDGPKSLDPDEVARLNDYVFHLAALPGSGEYAYTALLTPYAFARRPLRHRVNPQTLTVPCVVMFGEHDWINMGGAEAMVRGLPGDSRVVYFSGANHTAMLENPSEFNQFVLEELGYVD